LHSIPPELIDKFVKVPMSAEAIQDASMVFKKALIERALGSVRNIIERRPGKAKTGEEAEFRGLSEHSEPVFNAASSSADTFRTEPNYTQEEQESLGVDICRWVLGLDETEIVDIRNQHNVGADAIDMFNNFYEYKEAQEYRCPTGHALRSEWRPSRTSAHMSRKPTPSSFDPGKQTVLNAQ
jgi:hypothetical protein